jgi:hypothetical protein
VEGSSQPADDYTFLYGNENANHHIGARFYVHQAKRVEVLSGRIS